MEAVILRSNMARLCQRQSRQLMYYSNLLVFDQCYIALFFSVRQPSCRVVTRAKYNVQVVGLLSSNESLSTDIYC